MSYVKNRRIAAIAVAAGLLALTGCGSRSDASNPYGPIGGIPGGVIGGCIPINSQIGFTGTNAYFDAYNIRGGVIPGSNQALGQMSVTTAAAGGPYQRQGSDGTISMNVVPQGGINTGYNTGYNPGYNTGYPYYPQNPYPNPYMQPAGGASVTGFIALSPLVQGDISMRFGNGMVGTGYAYPYTQPGVVNPYAPPIANVCVSGIAIDIGHTYQGYTLYGGQVYLYMNNTQHGYVLYF